MDFSLNKTFEVKPILAYGYLVHLNPVYKDYILNNIKYSNIVANSDLFEDLLNELKNNNFIEFFKMMNVLEKSVEVADFSLISLNDEKMKSMIISPVDIYEEDNITFKVLKNKFIHKPTYNQLYFKLKPERFLVDYEEPVFKLFKWFKNKNLLNSKHNLEDFKKYLFWYSGTEIIM